jgi:tRNA pseudouridine38-40 synthase
MVRSLVGTMVEVGKGKLPPDKLNDLLLTGERSLAGPTAPPQGLFLVEVRY